MYKRHYHKASIILAIFLISSFVFRLERGICELDPSKKSYNLQAYSINENFCQDEAPTITKIFKATKSGKGKEVVGRLQNVFERTRVNDDNCAISMKFYEEYPGDTNPLMLQFEYKTNSEKGWVERGFSSGDPPSIKWTYDDPPLVSPFYELNIGDKWGGAFTSRGKYIDCTNCADISLSRVYEYSLIGIDDVSVPYGIFSDCLRIARFRGSMPDMISWYCPGIGQVKMIYSDSGPYSRKFELESISVSE